MVSSLLFNPFTRARKEKRGKAERAGGQREGGSKTTEGRGEGEEEERIQRKSDGSFGCTGATEEKERAKKEEERTSRRWGVNG